MTGTAGANASKTADANTDKRRSAYEKLRPIYIAVILDSMGLMMIAPFVVYYITEFTDKKFIIGLVISSFAIAQVIGSIFVGRLCDRFGRRPGLLVCVFGTCTACLFQGLSPHWGVLIVARVYAGLSGMSPPIGAAYVTDFAKGKEQEKQMGILGGLQISVNVISPVIAGAVYIGLEMGTELSTVNKYRVIFFVASFFTFFGFLYCWYNVPESIVKSKEEQARRAPLNRGPVVLLCVASVFYFFGFLNLCVVYPLFLEERFGLGPLAFIGFLFVNGITGTLSSMYLLQYLLHTMELSLHDLMKMCSIGNGIIITAVGFLASKVPIIMFLHFFLLIFMCIVFPLYNSALMMLGAHYAHESNKSETLGILSASIFIAYVFAPNICVNIYSIVYWGPFLLSGILSFVALGLITYLEKNYPFKRMDKLALQRMSRRMSTVGFGADLNAAVANIEALNTDDEETDSVMDDDDVERLAGAHRESLRAETTGKGTSI